MLSVPNRAISIMQPWAHAIVRLGKNVENREKWLGSSFRGPVLIHASKGVGSLDEFDGSCDALRTALGNEEAWGEFRDAYLDLGPSRTRFVRRPRATLRCGGIVGRARVVDVIMPGGLRHAGPGLPPAQASDRVHELAGSPWYFGGFALVLADAEPLPFVPCAGALNFWYVPEDVRRAIARGP